MNRIRESMEGIRATQDLKADTLRYLEERRMERSRPVWRRKVTYVLAAVCLFLFLGAGGYHLYSIPASYISIDVNPSIELGINRYGRVVTAEAYNEDGQEMLELLSMKNMPYVQAVSSLLKDETYGAYLTGNAAVVFTIISDDPDAIREKLAAIGSGQSYQVLTYVSDSYCMQEAHLHEMSFGKYRAYLELSAYDRSVTVEDCHAMTMGEIQDRIEGCRGQHEETEHNENHGNGEAAAGNGDESAAGNDDEATAESNDSGHHSGHHGEHHK